MYIIPVGIICLLLLLHLHLIKRFNLKTPGREDDDTETKLYTKADVKARDAAGKGGADGKASSTISQTITQASAAARTSPLSTPAPRLRCSLPMPAW